MHVHLYVDSRVLCVCMFLYMYVNKQCMRVYYGHEEIDPKSVSLRALRRSRRQFVGRSMPPIIDGGYYNLLARQCHAGVFNCFVAFFMLRMISL